MPLGDAVVEILAGLPLFPLLIAGIMLIFRRSDRICHGCGAKISSDATRCRHCGFGFETNSEGPYRPPPGEDTWNREEEPAERSSESDVEPESSPFGALSCVLCGKSAPAGECVMVPERGPLCSLCVEAIISAATPAQRRP